MRLFPFARITHSLEVTSCVTAVTFAYALNFNATASVNGLPARLSASPATVAIAAGAAVNLTVVVTAPSQLDTTTYVFQIRRLPVSLEAQFVKVRRSHHSPIQACAELSHQTGPGALRAS